MYAKTEEYAKNNRSLIDANFLVNETVGMILVCGHAESWTVYVERAHQDIHQRLITKYNLNFPNDFGKASSISKWSEVPLSNSEETFKDIKAMKKASHTVHQHQASANDLQTFISSMNIECKKRDIPYDSKDDGIISALNNIDQTLELSNNHKGCTIS